MYKTTVNNFNVKKPNNPEKWKSQKCEKKNRKKNHFFNGGNSPNYCCVHMYSDDKTNLHKKICFLYENNENSLF